MLCSKSQGPNLVRQEQIRVRLGNKHPAADQPRRIGTVDQNSIDVPWRTSIGASVIWDSPFGPLRGDFAHVLNKSTADRTQVFQITMQSLF